MVRPQTVVEPTAAATSRQAGSSLARTERCPWWLWPHLLSLDAPIVALAWQDWWSRSIHEPLGPGQRFVLGGGVWLIYLADRLADVLRLNPEHAGTARHRFAAARHRSLSVLATGVMIGLVVLSPLVLPIREFFAGLGLLAAAAVYFWLIHRHDSPSWTRRMPKEAVVGGMFALGTAFFAVCRPLSAPRLDLLMSGAVLFGFVCFLNCALITSWERNLCDRRDPASLLNAFPRLADGGLAWLCWLTVMLAGVATLAEGSAMFLPLALSAALLACLDRWRRHLPANALRCIADVVLLTPWVCQGMLVVYQ